MSIPKKRKTPVNGAISRSKPTYPYFVLNLLTHL